MTFTPKAWVDEPNTTTPVTAAELIRIERAIDRAYGRTPQILASASTTTETVIAQWDLAANEASINDGMNLRVFGQAAGNATHIFRLRMGVLGTIVDPALVTFTTSAAGVANAHWSVDAMIAILSATTATAGGTAQLASASIGPVTAAFAAAAINLTMANKISITQQLSAAQANTTRAASMSWIA